MRARSFRRHQKQRILRKWRTIGLRWGIDQKWFESWLYRTAENMPTCSNPFCCGNPRKLGDLTEQEKRAIISEEEQRNEIASLQTTSP